jgi:hypothetical protein
MIGSVACPLSVTGRVVLGSRAVEPAAMETLMLMAPLTTYNNVVFDNKNCGGEPHSGGQFH